MLVKQLYKWMVFAGVLVASCGDSGGEPVVEIYPEFRPFVTSFEQDAAERGVDIDFESRGISILLGPITEADAAGICRGDGTIEIQNSLWNSLSQSQRERLIYHEFGHCVLDRRHRNDILSNDEWSSIMRGSPVPDGREVSLNYSGARKEYYVDELFDENIGPPSWINISRGYNEDIFTDTILYIPNSEKIDEGQFVDTGRDFQIEFVFQNNDLARAGLRWGGTDIDNSFFILSNHLKDFQIITGRSIFGTLVFKNNFGILDQTQNKFTVRKIEGLYYFFVNEQFVYWTEFVPFNGTAFESLAFNSTGFPQPDYPHVVQEFVISYAE